MLWCANLFRLRSLNKTNNNRTDGSFQVAATKQHCFGASARSVHGLVFPAVLNQQHNTVSLGRNYWQAPRCQWTALVAPESSGKLASAAWLAEPVDPLCSTSAIKPTRTQLKVRQLDLTNSETHQSSHRPSKFGHAATSTKANFLLQQEKNTNFRLNVLTK